MYLVHESADGRRRVLASDVERADSTLAQVKGLMGRSDVPDDYALVFEGVSDPVERAVARLPGPLSALADPERQGVHMLFVRTPLDVVWLRDEEVVEKQTLAPWTGTGGARADRFVELAGGAADGVEPGDRVWLTDSLSGGVLADWRSTGWRNRHRAPGV